MALISIENFNLGENNSTKEMSSGQENFEGSMDEVWSLILRRKDQEKLWESKGRREGKAVRPRRKKKSGKLIDITIDDLIMLSEHLIEKQKRLLGLKTGGKHRKEVADKPELDISGLLAEQGSYCCSENISEESDLPIRLQNLPIAKQHAIYRLPRSRSVDDKYLTPRLVFIGPYHNCISYRSNMTYHKFRFFKDFLLRNPSRSSEHYREEIKKLEPQLRKYYSPDQHDTRRVKFVNMMVLDGCFILEFLIKYYNHDPDEIFENGSLSRDIKTDLLMFENQIPFMVLVKLYELQNTGSLPCFYRLLVNYFWGTSSGWPTLRTSECHNLLHFYHLQFVPLYVNEDQIGKNSKRYQSAKLNEKFVSQIPSIEQLEKAGVTFRGKITNNFLDIRFQNGVLEIPIICLDEPFVLFFVNLAMFEKHNVAVGKVVQTYCCFMHCLLSNPQDVELLRNNGIIEKNSISDQELCDLFGQFHNADYMNSEKHHFADLFADLWEFCEKFEKTNINVERSKVKCSSFFLKACIVVIFGLLFHFWTRYYA